MKQLKFGMIAVASALMLAACKTTVTSTPVVTNGVTNLVQTTNTTFAGIAVTPSGLYNSLKAATADGANIAKADTNAVQYMVALRAVIGDALGGTNVDMTALQAAVNQLPLSSIHSPVAVEAIQQGFSIFAALLPTIIAQTGSNNRFVMPALQGVYDGLSQALGYPVTPYVPTSLEPSVILPRPLIQKCSGLAQGKSFFPVVSPIAVEQANNAGFVDFFINLEALTK
ncbi:MAG TPA: hypothetical protein VH413_16265 [Verrucomicrobiae bacterium]|nr:hypothetical protein [Verrucomicrobiae bacterium]